MPFIRKGDQRAFVGDGAKLQVLLRQGWELEDPKAEIQVRTPEGLPLVVRGQKELDYRLRGAEARTVIPSERQLQEEQFQQEVEEELSGTGAKALTGLVSVLEGLSLGLSTEIAARSGADRDQLNALKAANPITSGLSYLGGVALPALVTGGAGAGAGAAGASASGVLRLTPAGIATSLGERAAARLAGGRITRLTTLGAVEGGVAGGGQAAVRVLLDDKERTSEQIVSEVLGETLWGAGIGGGIGFTGGVLARSADAISGSVLKSATPILDDASPQAAKLRGFAVRAGSQVDDLFEAARQRAAVHRNAHAAATSEPASTLRGEERFRDVRAEPPSGVQEGFADELSGLAKSREELAALEKEAAEVTAKNAQRESIQEEISSARDVVREAQADVEARRLEVEELKQPREIEPEPAVEPEPVPEPSPAAAEPGRANPSEELRAAYFKLSGGRVNVTVGMEKLRAELPHLSRGEFDEAAVDLFKRGPAALFPEDNRAALTRASRQEREARESSALILSGEPKHFMKMEWNPGPIGPESATPQAPATRAPPVEEAAPSAESRLEGLNDHQAAAELVPRDRRFGDLKVYIADAYDAYKARTGRRLSMEEFKAELLEMNRRGEIHLHRADMPAAMDKPRVAASEIEVQLGSSNNPTFHFIESIDSPRLGGGKRGAQGGGRVFNTRALPDTPEITAARAKLKSAEDAYGASLRDRIKDDSLRGAVDDAYDELERLLSAPRAAPPPPPPAAIPAAKAKPPPPPPQPRLAVDKKALAAARGRLTRAAKREAAARLELSALERQLDELGPAPSPQELRMAAARAKVAESQGSMAARMAKIEAALADAQSARGRLNLPADDAALRDALRDMSPYQAAALGRRMDRYVKATRELVALVDNGSMAGALGKLDEATAGLRAAIETAPGSALHGGALEDIDALLKASGLPNIPKEGASRGLMLSWAMSRIGSNLEDIAELSRRVKFARQEGGVRGVTRAIREEFRNAAARRVAGGLTRPGGATTGMAVRGLFGLTGRAGRRYAQRLGKVVGAARGPGRGVPIAAAALATRTPTPEVRRLGVLGRKGVEEQMEFVRRAATNPEGTRQAIQAKMLDVRMVDYRLADEIELRTMDLLRYMFDKLPVNPGSDALMGPGKWVPSATEKHRFSRILRAAHDPSRLLDEIAEGRLTRETVETVRVGYPRMFEQMRTDIITNLAEMREGVPRQVRHQLSIFFDIPIDPIMQPQNILAVQRGFMKPPAPPARQTGGRLTARTPPTPAQMTMGAR